MAFYIEMDLIENNESEVIYAFGRDNNTGLIKLDKKDGVITVIRACPLDERGSWALRAGRKLALLSQKDTFPAKTEWAS